MGDKQSKQKSAQESQPVKDEEKLPSSSVDGPFCKNVEKENELESNEQNRTTDTSQVVRGDDEPQKHTGTEDVSNSNSDAIHTTPAQSSADIESSDHHVVFENHFTADHGFKTKADSSDTQAASISESMFSSLPVNLGQDTSKEAFKMTSSLTDRSNNQPMFTTYFVHNEDILSGSQARQNNMVHRHFSDSKLQVTDVQQLDSNDQDVDRSPNSASAENLSLTPNANDTERIGKEEIEKNESISSPQKPLSDMITKVTEKQITDHRQKQYNDDSEIKETSLKEPISLTSSADNQKQLIQLHVQNLMKENVFMRRAKMLEQNEESVLERDVMVSSIDSIKQQPQDTVLHTDEKTSDADFYQNISSEHKTNQIFSSEHQTNQNIPSEHQTSQNILSEHKTNQTIPSEHQTSQNITSEHQTSQNIPSEHKPNQNILSEHQTNQNIPSEHQTNQNIPSEHQTNQNIPFEHQTNIPNRSWNLGRQKPPTFVRLLSQTSSIPERQQNITFPMKTVSVETETSAKSKVLMKTKIESPPMPTSNSGKDAKNKGDNSARPVERKQTQMIPVSNLSSSFQMVHKEFRSVCAYIKELQLSNRSILKKLTEEKSQYEQACKESDKRVADLDHCVVCLEQRIKQREMQIRQMTQLVQHLLQKVNELGEALDCMPEFTSNDEEEETDSDVEDNHYPTFKVLPHISKHEDGFRRQAVLHQADNRCNFKIEGRPKSRHLRRLASAKSAEKAKLAFAGLPDKENTAAKHREKSYNTGRSLKSQPLKDGQRKLDEVNTGTSRSHGRNSVLSTDKRKFTKAKNTQEAKVDTKEMKTAKRESKHGKLESQKAKEQRKNEETNIPHVQKRPTEAQKANQALSGTLIRNEFRNALTAATDMTEGRTGLPGVTLDLNGWIALANLKMHKDVGFIPRGNGPDTVLCLDVSESMAGEPFSKMIALANKFVDGVQELQMTLGIEQNVALVTFGHTTTVIQHLTNDYKVIKEQINNLSAGGPSPLVAGLLMCIAAAVGNGGTCVIDGFRIHAEIIIMTDGRATGFTLDMDPDPREVDPMSDWEVRSKLVAVVHDIKNRKYSISYVACGNFYPSHMKEAAAITGGKEFKPDQIQQVYKRPKNLVLGNELKKHLQSSGMDLQDLALVKSAVRGLCSEDVTSADVNDLAEIICHPVHGNVEKEEDHDDIRDKLGLTHREIPESNMPPIGTRMRRGPDWSWGNQDSNGPGTVVSHKTNGWIWIMWDNGHRNQYCYGANEKYDVIIVDEPRILQKDQLIEVGCLVKRGPDWNDGNADGTPGNVGVVVRVHENATVGVRWPNGKLCNHKYSCNGKFEVSLCDPSEHAARMLDEAFSAAASGGQSSLEDKEQYDPNMDKILEEMNKRNKNNTKPKSVQKDTKSEVKQNIRTPQSVTTLSDRDHDPQDKQSASKDPLQSSQKLNVSQDKKSASKNPLQSSQKLNVLQNMLSTAANVIPQNTENDRPNVKSEEVEWQYKDEYGKWTCFSDENNRKIEKVYTKNPVGLTVVTVAKSNHRILLKQMLMVNTSTKAVTNIRRKSA